MRRGLIALTLVAGLAAVEPPPLTLAVTGDVLHANTLEFGSFALRDVVATPDYRGTTYASPRRPPRPTAAK